jgi:hypothetical protein
MSQLINVPARVTTLGEFLSNGRLFRLVSILKITNRKSPNFWATFLHNESYVLIGTKMGWAAFCAIFFTNSSGHPGLPAQFNLR